MHRKPEPKPDPEPELIYKYVYILIQIYKYKRYTPACVCKCICNVSYICACAKIYVDKRYICDARKPRNSQYMMDRYACTNIHIYQKHTCEPRIPVLILMYESLVHVYMYICVLAYIHTCTRYMYTRIHIYMSKRLILVYKHLVIQGTKYVHEYTCTRDFYTCSNLYSSKRRCMYI